MIINYINDNESFDYEVSSEQLREFFNEYSKYELITFLLEKNAEDDFEDEIKEFFEEDAYEDYRDAIAEEEEIKYLRNQGRI